MSEFDANGVDALPGVPRVDVIDETGRAVDTGYYFRHIKRTPCVFGDCVRPEDVEHFVVVDEFSDWNMPRGFKAMRITPPYTVEIHKEQVESA